MLLHVGDTKYEKIALRIYEITLSLSHYNVRAVKAIDFLFSTLHTTPFLSGRKHFRVKYCNVQYPTGLKPTITLGRSNQIISNLVQRSYT